MEYFDRVFHGLTIAYNNPVLLRDILSHILYLVSFDIFGKLLLFEFFCVSLRNGPSYQRYILCPSPSEGFPLERWPYTE